MHTVEKHKEHEHVCVETAPTTTNAHPSFTEFKTSQTPLRLLLHISTILIMNSATNKQNTVQNSTVCENTTATIRV